ncbi:tRNA (adenine(58)-N(1))-methyltransferase non-catalytic subunit trm6 [Coelomomyces lativittatus]|nr:tRNA (adenine(58)-N(1))-methyltransferase non-catalytic subunit trm6 [Coelomomyces lativittatus]
MTEHSNSLSPLNHLQNSGSLNNIPSNTDLIQSGHYVFLQLPSENLRLIQLKENKWVELGKFGKFNANSILNQPFGWTYRIKEDHTLEKVIEELEESDSDSEQEMTLKNNKTIRDMNTNQKLSYDEIMELKVSKKGEVCVNSLVSFLSYLNYHSRI